MHGGELDPRVRGCAPSPAGAETPAQRDPCAGSSSTHLVLVAGWDGEDGAAVHLPHEELGHTVRRGTQPGSATGRTSSDPVRVWGQVGPRQWELRCLPWSWRCRWRRRRGWARGWSWLWGPSWALVRVAAGAGARARTPYIRAPSRVPLVPSCHVGAVRVRGDGARAGLWQGAVGSGGSCSVGPLAKSPYVLLKDTAMVSTAFSNSRLSVSLLDS